MLFDYPYCLCDECDELYWSSYKLLYLMSTDKPRLIMNIGLLYIFKAFYRSKSSVRRCLQCFGEFVQTRLQRTSIDKPRLPMNIGLIYIFKAVSRPQCTVRRCLHYIVYTPLQLTKQHYNTTSNRNNEGSIRTTHVYVYIMVQPNTRQLISFVNI